MYVSPIELIINSMYTEEIKQQEDEIYRAIMSYGVNADKDELVKALNYDRQQYEKGYKDAIVEFAEYLKDNSFLCDPNDSFSFQAINVEDDLDDLIEVFLRGKGI